MIQRTVLIFFFLLGCGLAVESGQPGDPAGDSLKPNRADTAPSVLRARSPSARPRDESGEGVAPESIRVSNVFYESDLLQALRDLSAQTGISIVTDANVQGVVTLELVDLPFEEALKRILYPLGFTFRRQSDYYLVGSVKPDGPSFFMLAASENIHPGYLKAEDAYKLMPDYYRPYLKLDTDVNTLSITAPQELIDKFKQDLARIDRPKPQVLIEALVTEISMDAAQSLGVDWSGTLLHGADSVLRVGTGVGSLMDTTLGLIAKILTGRAGTWGYSFMPTLQALVQDGKVKIRANPRIATVEGQQASIVVGKEQYYEIITGNPAYPYAELQKIEVGVSLNITPYVSESGEIIMNVEPTVSDVIGHGVTQLPIVSKRSVKTKVMVKDGEKIVIGGLMMKTENEVKRRIPFLGNIPFIGALFSNTVKQTDNNEVVIIITPHILK